MKTAAVLLGVLSLCAASATAGKSQGTRVRIEVTRSKVHKPMHGKFTVLPIGAQCAYDPKNDPSLYPCRDRGVCVRTSPTYGKCFTKEEAEKLQAEAEAEGKSASIRSGVTRSKVHKPMHGKFTVLPIGAQCAYDPKNDASLYPCRDRGVCVRTSPTYGKCFTKDEAEKLQAEAEAEGKSASIRSGVTRSKVHKPMHGKFTVLPIGAQCAYDPKNDASLYPCRDRGVCVRTSPTYGKCFTKEEAEKLQAEAEAENKSASVDGSGSDVDGSGSDVDGSGSDVDGSGSDVDGSGSDDEDGSGEDEDAELESDSGNVAEEIRAGNVTCGSKDGGPMVGGTNIHRPVGGGKKADREADNEDEEVDDEEEEDEEEGEEDEEAESEE